MSDSFDEMRKMMNDFKNTSEDNSPENEIFSENEVKDEQEPATVEDIQNNGETELAEQNTDTIDNIVPENCKICPNCNNKCNIEAVFCNKCGAKLEIEHKCPNCGADYTEDDVFCIKCGTKLQEEKVQIQEEPISEVKHLYCGICGAEYHAGDTFCGECGTNLITNEAFALKSPQTSVNNNDITKQDLQKETNTSVSSNQNNNAANYNNNEIKCPYCGSTVKAGIMKCPHCGEWLKRKKPLGCYNILSWTIFVISLISAWAITQDFWIGLAWGFGIVIGLWIYFIPAWVAEIRRHPNAGAIFAVNLLLGETVIGWIIALIWALCGGGDR